VAYPELKEQVLLGQSASMVQAFDRLVPATHVPYEVENEHDPLGQFASE
jgi:hypothetical protein